MPLPPLPLAPLLVPGTAEEEVEGVLTPEPGTDAPMDPESRPMLHILFSNTSDCN